MTRESRERTSSALPDEVSAASALPELLSSLDAIVWEKDAASGRFTFVSERAVTLLGHPVARWLDDGDFWADEIVHPEDRAIATRLHEGAFTDDAGQATYRVRAADGRTLWVRDIVRRPGNGGDGGRLAGLTMDVTAERTSHDRKLQLSGILERITDAFFALDREWRFTYVNQQAERLLRRDASELLGRLIWDEFPEARDSAFWDVYHRAMESGQAETFQEFYPPLEAWYEVNAYPSADGLSVYFREVTRQKLATQEIERHQARLLLALEAGRMGTWEWDIRDQRVIWSPEEERLYGLEPGTFDGTVDGYVSRIHPEDRARSWQALEEAMRTGAEGHHVIHRIVRPTGEVRWLDSHGRFVYGEDGTAIRLVGVSADVTERMRFERMRERQDEMLGAVDIGLWYCDLPFDVLEWDRKVKEHFWLPPDALVTIDTFYDRIHPDDRERTREAIDTSIASNSSYDIEYRTVAPDRPLDEAPIRWVRAIGYTAYGPDGKPVRFDGITVDVTAQKLVAERLAASEQRYEYASRATSNAIWDWNLTNDKVRWNPGLYRVFGYERDEVEETAQWWYEHIHPEDREAVVGGIHEVIDDPQGASDWKDEYRYRRRDGTYAWIIDRGHVARDERGRAVRMIGAMEDVTEQREAEARVRRSEERFQTLVDKTEQYIWTANSAGHLEREQPAWERLTGQAPADYEGEGWVTAIHPDDREDTLARWTRAVANRALFEVEHRVRTASGEYRHFWVRGIPILEEEGHVREWVGVHTDITERKRAERALLEEAQIVDTLQRIGATLASELDLDRIVQTVTDEATRLTGAQFGAFFYNVLDEKGESYTLYSISGVPREAFATFSMPRNTEVFSPTFHGEGTIRSDDITKDPRYGRNPPYNGMPAGHLPVTSYLAVSVRSHSGEVIGGLFFGHGQPAVFSDRHERLVEGIAAWAALAMDNARLFAAERDSRAEAEEANLAKSQFLARMSHDLRTPLNAIGGYSQLIEMELHGPVTPAQRDALARVRRATDHLLTLINDILSFARLEAGQVHIKCTDVEISARMAELDALFQPEAERRGVRLEVVPHTGRDFVWADGERLTQVLGNLISNALKFTEAGGGVRVWSEVEADHVCIRIEDSGIGIPPERLQSIFDPFVQARGTDDERREGVGLGLAISRELARMMDAELSVVSVPDVGSTFSLRLLRVEEGSAREADPVEA